MQDTSCKTAAVGALIAGWLLYRSSRETAEELAAAESGHSHSCDSQGSTADRAAAGAFPIEWGELEEDGDREWWRATNSRALPLDCSEVVLVASMVQSHCPTTKLLNVRRIQNRLWWRDYVRYRDEHVVPTSVSGANEALLFHGTADLTAEPLLQHQHALDPSFGSGGFYGSGT